MDFLTLLNGATIAFNPLSIIHLAAIGWLIGMVSRLKDATNDRINALDKQIAVILANQDYIKSSVSEIKESQMTILKTMNLHHNQNIRTLFRRGIGAPLIEPQNAAATDEND
jgi:hypothetical protein